MTIGQTGINVTCIAAGALAYHLWCAVRGRAAGRWPTARGTVLSSSIEVTRGARGGTNIDAYVSYSYDVAGIAYTGTRINFGPWGRTAFSTSALKDEAAVAREHYQPGKSVDVRYDPRKPSRAVLEPGTTAQTWLWVFAEVAALLVGILFLVAAAARGRLTSG